MKTIDKELPKRFQNAVTKLYNAFHENRLDAFDCTACAIGNLCDNQEEWQLIRFWQRGESTPYLGNYIGTCKEQIDKTGYTPIEIIKIENIFTNSFDSGVHNGKNKNQQFVGLCNVIEHLCQLEGIENIMDYTSLFETNEKSEPKKQLNF